MLPANGDIAGPQGSPSPSVYLQADRTPHLRDYWHLVLQRRWTVLACFAIIATTAAIYTFSLTPTYRATAAIKIDSERPQILSFQEIGSSGHRPPAPNSWAPSRSCCRAAVWPGG